LNTGSSNTAPGAANDYNTKIIEEFRANEGRVGGSWAGYPLISHPSHRRQVRDRARHAAGLLPSGRRPLRDVASHGGSPTHPDWYYNLRANPRIKVEVGPETFTVLAQELDDAARAELWPNLVADAPQLGEFQTRITRQIPVFMLTRQD
jgi:deazaflavin-dependent oxidoreductase (nitroreductase family)